MPARREQTSVTGRETATGEVVPFMPRIRDTRSGAMLAGHQDLLMALRLSMSRARVRRDPFGRFLDFPVSEVGVAKRHSDIGMAGHARDHGQRHAVHHRVARMRVAEVVEAHVLDTRLLANPVPDRELMVARAGRWRPTRRRWSRELP